MGRVLFTLQHLIIDSSAAPASLLRKALDASAARLISGSVMSLRLLSIAVPSPARGVVWTRLGGEWGEIVFSLDGLSNPPTNHTGARGEHEGRGDTDVQDSLQLSANFRHHQPSLPQRRPLHSAQLDRRAREKARNMRVRCLLTFDEDAQSLHGQPGNL